MFLGDVSPTGFNASVLEKIKSLCSITIEDETFKYLIIKIRRSGGNQGLCEIESSFATICKEFTVKPTQKILKITSGCQSNFILQFLLSTKHGMLEEY